MSNLYGTSSSYGDTTKSSARDAGLADKAIEVKDKLGEMGDMIIEAKDKAFDRGSSLLASLKSTVEARPFSSVAIAFLVGYVGMRITRPLRWL
jgi:hypothetical protein